MHDHTPERLGVLSHALIELGQPAHCLGTDVHSRCLFPELFGLHIRDQGVERVPVRICDGRVSREQLSQKVFDVGRIELLRRRVWFLLFQSRLRPRLLFLFGLGRRPERNAIKG